MTTKDILSNLALTEEIFVLLQVHIYRHHSEKPNPHQHCPSSKVFSTDESSSSDCRPPSEVDEDAIRATPAKCSEDSATLLLGQQSDTRRSSLCTSMAKFDVEKMDGLGLPSMQAGGALDLDADLPRVSFCCVGLYKGSVVAIKNIRKRHIDLSRNIRKELKQVNISLSFIILYIYFYIL